MSELIPLENVNAIELFRNDKTLKALLVEIRKAATDFKPDTSTDKGRKQIASQAYKVSQSKTVINNARLEMVSAEKKRLKIIDERGKTARDFCDDLRDEIREPLTRWEEEEKRRVEALALQAEIDADEILAYERDDLFEREKKVREHEERIEAERLETERKERESREEAERVANEERIRKEAGDKATREAAIKLQQETERAEKAERERVEANAKAVREKAEAREKADRDKQEAIEREQRLAKDEAERIERERLRRIEDEQREAQARAADRENRRKINNAIVKALVDGGVSERAAKIAVTLIASGKIPSVSIRY